MKNQCSLFNRTMRLAAVSFGFALLLQSVPVSAQPDRSRPQESPREARDDFDGPPPFGPGGPGGPGGFGGMQQKTSLVEKFDKDGDKRLNAAERKAAREYLKTNAQGRGRRGPRFGRRDSEERPNQPGQKLSPADVKSYPESGLYDPLVVRTVFLEFEDSDWEQELADFKDTDVEVPAKLVVDGKTYPDVGVHFRGMSSFMMVGQGQKRSLNVSLDFVHKDQQIGGYRTLNLLNSHEDPTFLRSVLFYQVAREYLPAPKSNFARVVINGESWGLYVNVQQFNKDFVKDWFGTTKGARWKVRGSPNGRGSLAYLGEDPEEYKQIYQIKSKDDAKSWADLIKLCKVLNETPSNKLEEALSPLLDIDGALKFLALDNGLINNDGYWIRTSDYSIYEDKNGKFHIIPQDANETFSKPESPGFGGPGGPGGFNPAGMLASRMFSEADQNNDRKLTQDEFAGLAGKWFVKLDPDKAGKLDQEQFTSKIGEVLPMPGRFGPPDNNRPQQDGPQPQRRRGGFGPATPIGQDLFKAADQNQDGFVTVAELGKTFGDWFKKWDSENSGQISEEKFQQGLSTALPMPVMRTFGGRRGPGGPGNGVRINGVELDPLIAAKDTTKPLISKLLAVPSLRERYLGYVHEISEKWLDWTKLGPVAEQYHSMIADDIKSDTRKLDSTDEFTKGLIEDVPANGPAGVSIGIKSFADQRRAYLQKYWERAKTSK